MSQDAPHETDAPHESDRERLDVWSLALAKLSLDLTRGLYARMALYVPDEEAFRALLREAITRGRESDDPDPVEIVARLVEDVMSGVRARFGEETVRRLREWERDACFVDFDRFAPLVRWARTVGSRPRPGESTPPPLVQRIRAERARTAAPDIPRRPESDWDVDYFERHGYSLNDTGVNPMDTVANTIRHVDFRRAWDRALGAGADRESELADLVRWATHEADRLNIGAAKLGPPGAWPPAPAPPHGG